MRIETILQPAPVCPSCGHKHLDAWEWNFGSWSDGQIERDCDECGKPMIVDRVVFVDYTTKDGGART